MYIMLLLMTLPWHGLLMAAWPGEARSPPSPYGLRQARNGHWHPKTAGELNGQAVRLVKFQGPFLWRHHEEEDELFLVIKGRFTMQLRDANIEVGEGEFVIIPRGVEHCPVAEEEVHVLLFEPVTTRNTGNVVNERTTGGEKILRSARLRRLAFGVEVVPGAAVGEHPQPVFEPFPFHWPR